jgi:ATP-dependent DNA helicase RecG
VARILLPQRRIIIEKDRIYADSRNRSSHFGKLDPDTFTPEPKNPILAHFFENIGYADQLGSGVRNLYKYTAIYTNGGKPELIEGDTFKTIIPLPDAVVSEVAEKVTEKELAVLKCIEQNPAITSTELAGKLAVSRKTVSAWIKELKDKGIIERAGSDRKGYWTIMSRIED